MQSIPVPTALVKRATLSGVGEHFGVLRSDWSVFENTLQQGARIVTWQEFAANRPVKAISLLSESQTQASALRLRSELERPKRYDFFSNNCETAANRVVGREPRSTQVEGLYLIAGLALILVALN